MTPEAKQAAEKAGCTYHNPKEYKAYCEGYDAATAKLREELALVNRVLDNRMVQLSKLREELLQAQSACITQRGLLDDAYNQRDKLREEHADKTRMERALLRIFAWATRNAPYPECKIEGNTLLQDICEKGLGYWPATAPPPLRREIHEAD